MSGLVSLVSLMLFLATVTIVQGCKPSATQLRASMEKCLQPSLARIVRSPRHVINFVFDDSKWYKNTKENICTGDMYTPECWISSLVFLLAPHSPIYLAASNCICKYSGKCQPVLPDTAMSPGLRSEMVDRCQPTPKHGFTLSEMRFSRCIAQKMMRVSRPQTIMDFSISTFLLDHYTYCRSNVMTSYSYEQRLIFMTLHLQRVCPQNTCDDFWRENILDVYIEATRTDSPMCKAIVTCGRELSLHTGVMSGLCCSRGSGVKQPADFDSHYVQVANSDGQKWITGRNNSVVPVEESDKGQFWNLENNPDDKTQWSFHIVSKRKKLYVTYNGDDPSDENVWLEEASSNNTKNRFFKALVQASARVLLISTTSNNRILWVKNKKLVMLVVDNFQDKDWYISPTPDSFMQFDTKYRVEIRDPIDSLYWKSDDPIVGNFIELSNSQDVWESIISPTGFSFMPSSNIYVSVKAHSDVDILFESLVTKADLRKFTTSGFSGVMLKSVYNNRYVSVNRDPRNPVLRLEQDEAHAVGWHLTVVGFIFVLEDGSEIHFPPLCKTGAKTTKYS